MLELGDFGAARKLQEEAVAIVRSLEDRRKLSQALSNLAGAVLRLGEHAIAQAALEEALQLERELEDSQGMGTSLGGLAGIAIELGEFGNARRLLLEGLAILLELGDRRESALLLEALAHVESSISPNARAATLWGVAEQLRSAVGSPMPELESTVHSARVAAARTALLDDAAFDFAWNRGLVLTWDELRQELGQAVA